MIVVVDAQRCSQRAAGSLISVPAYAVRAVTGRGFAGSVAHAVDGVGVRRRGLACRWLAASWADVDAPGGRADVLGPAAADGAGDRGGTVSQDRSQVGPVTVEEGQTVLDEAPGVVGLALDFSESFDELCQATDQIVGVPCHGNRGPTWWRTATAREAGEKGPPSPDPARRPNLSYRTGTLAT